MNAEASVGVAELRQNLSRYLRRAQRGERLVVTDHNRPVAELGPPSSAGGELDRLIAEGRLTRPPRRGFPEALHLEGEEAKQAQIYFSLYFAMTGLHALHMIIGVPILLTLAVFAWKGHYSPAWSTPVELTGLYWHFVDIVWIFLFPFLYLIQ